MDCKFSGLVFSKIIKLTKIYLLCHFFELHYKFEEFFYGVFKKNKYKYIMVLFLIKKLFLKSVKHQFQLI